MTTRIYKRARKPAPALPAILRGRAAGRSFAAIAKRAGCDRRTVYLALDRLASAGALAPLLVPVLHPRVGAPAERLWRRIAAAKKAGAPVPGWDEDVRAARGVRMDELGPRSPAVLQALAREYAAWA